MSNHKFKLYKNKIKSSLYFGVVNLIWLLIIRTFPTFLYKLRSSWIFSMETAPHCGGGIKSNFRNFLKFGMRDLTISRKEYKSCIKIRRRVYTHIVIYHINSWYTSIFTCDIQRRRFARYQFPASSLLRRKISVNYNKFRY